MGRLTLSVLLVICGSRVFAQSPDPVTCTAASQTEVVLTNNSDVAVSAFVLGRELPIPIGAEAAGRAVTRAAAATVFDPTDNPNLVRPIPPHQSITVREGRHDAPPRVFAVVFADGRSWGDPFWIDKVTGRRNGLRRGFEAVIADLKAALAGSAMNSDTLISRFQAALETEPRSAAGADEASAISGVRRSVLAHLRSLYPAGSSITTEGIQKEIDALEVRLTPLRSAGAAAQE